jgi:hypothetical protein
MEMDLTFEIDGRELAKSVMKNARMKKLEVIRRKCNWLKSEWEKEYETKITYGACANGDVEFNIYVNDYDYYSVSINIDEYTIMREIINIITFMLENRIEKLDFYKAPLVEKCIVDLLKENEIEDIYVFDGILCYSGLEFVLKDIKEFHYYDDEECIMRIYDALDGWYTINFDNGIIEEECN